MRPTAPARIVSPRPDLAVEALAAQHGPCAGVDGDVLDRHAHLSVVEFAELFDFETEAVGGRFADRPAGEGHACVREGHPAILARARHVIAACVHRRERSRSTAHMGQNIVIEPTAHALDR